jgi:hypothetical protein
MVVPVSLTLCQSICQERFQGDILPPHKNKQNEVMSNLVEKQQYENIHNLLTVVLKTSNIPR